jgi:hypothetical protein
MSDIFRWIIQRTPVALDAAMKIKIGKPIVTDETKSYQAALTSDKVMTNLALKWSVQSYVWNDLTSVVWVGPQYTESRIADFYLPLLEHGYLEMEKFMGCEDWVLFAIAQISSFEERIIEFPDSAERQEWSDEGGFLEQKLNAKLQSVLLGRLTCPHGLRREAGYVTEMWIHAALVYLHIVMSGTRSNHPKLRLHIGMGLNAYVNLPRHLDIHTAMPFGVLASMANDEEVQEFLRIAEPPRSWGALNPGQRKTFQIVKECWRMRSLAEASSTETGVWWRDGARSLKLIVLPV